MNMTENVNFILCLEKIGFTHKQITDFMLAIEGNITHEEFEKRFAQEEEEKKK